MQPLHLQVDGHLSPPATTKTAGLSELAAQFTIGTFEQGRSAHEFARDAPQRIEGNGLLKIPLQRRHRLWGLLSPGTYPDAQALVRLGGRVGLLNDTGLFQQLLAQFAVALSAHVFARFVSHIAQLVKDTALLNHTGAVHLSHRRA